MTSFAPDRGNIIYIPTAEKISYVESNYDALIEAIGYYESHNTDIIVNEKEQAYGRLQIRQCRVEHYNRLTGKSYTLKDMFDFKKSREVFLYFAEGKTYEQAAKSWNGSGPRTITYWDNITSILNNKPYNMRQIHKPIVTAIDKVPTNHISFAPKSDYNGLV
jgi:hypothetical protein